MTLLQVVVGMGLLLLFAVVVAFGNGSGGGGISGISSLSSSWILATKTRVVVIGTVSVGRS